MAYFFFTNFLTSVYQHFNFKLFRVYCFFIVVIYRTSFLFIFTILFAKKIQRSENNASALYEILGATKVLVNIGQINSLNIIHYSFARISTRAGISIESSQEKVTRVVRVDYITDHPKNHVANDNDDRVLVFVGIRIRTVSVAIATKNFYK